MTNMDDKLIEATARLVWMLREADGMTRWDGPGIMAKLREAAPTASSWDLARAALNLAENKELRTPGLLPQSGPHWLKPDGSKPQRRGDHTMTCPEHGEPYLSCQPCKATPTGPPPDHIRDELRAALEAAKTTHAQSAAEDRAREARKSRTRNDT